ncbi:MAG: hypothetical protein Q9191_004592, partial [Dirinaria sp. TL-2023a]
MLSVLVDSEEGGFLESRPFANAIARLCIELPTSGRQTDESEALLLEVLFEIAAKLRFKPDCIQCWFRPDAANGDEQLGGDWKFTSIPRLNEKQFPLFYSLLGSVHRKGRAGEFARTGLLYIIELSTHSESLEKWIIESDLATFMASGLGALYSQLSRNLVFTYTKDLFPPIIAFSDVSSQETALGAEEVASIENQSSLGAFLDYLMFWQDVLDHCDSADIKQILLEHFELLFLQQLLYPSLLESSDIDGGAVAVLTYLKCILQSLSNAELLSLVLRFLLALPKKNTESSHNARPTTIARRRKSESLISQRAIAKDSHSPDLFSLVDLTLTSLQSPREQTITATLRLLSVLLGPLHHYVYSQIIKTVPLDEEHTKWNIATHEKDVNALLDMADSLVDDDRLELCYANHLKDARSIIESHVCSGELLVIPDLETVLGDRPDEGHGQANLEKVHPHTLRLDDPSLQCLQALIETFFSNDIETNLGLTKVISTIVSCGYTQLNGWLLSSESLMLDMQGQQSTALISDNEKQPCQDYETDPLDKQDEDLNQGTGRTYRDHVDEEMPPLLNHFDALVAQVDRFSREIEDFDVYLAERRHVFKVGEDIENALNDAPAPIRTSQGSKATSPTRKKNPPQITSISERLLSGGNSAAVSRSSSPRGRQPEKSAPTLVSRLSHLRTSPSLSPAKTASSADTGSSHRKDSLTSTPPKGLRSPISLGNALRQKIKVPTNLAVATRSQTSNIGSSESSSNRSSDSHRLPQKRFREVTLSHLLTNIIILQEFLLELAAMVE